MGPPWDYDLAWYNADYCDNFNTSGWAFNINYVCQDAGVPFWWERLMSDTLFAQNLACRWDALRETTLKKSHFFGIIDSMANVLAEAQARNFAYWPILGKYVWPNPGQLPPTYAGEVAKMKSWLNNRFAWLDFAFGQNQPNLNAAFLATPLSSLNWRFESAGNPFYHYRWDFGDGASVEQASVEHTFGSPGNYAVKLTVTAPYGCSNSTTQVIHIIGVGVQEAAGRGDLQVFPNPVKEIASLVLPDDFPETFQLRLSNVLGESVFEQTCFSAGKRFSFRVGDLPSGTYSIEIRSEDKRASALVFIKN